MRIDKRKRKLFTKSRSSVVTGSLYYKGQKDSIMAEGADIRCQGLSYELPGTSQDFDRLGIRRQINERRRHVSCDGRTPQDKITR